MSKLEVDAIEPQSGTTITIGSSGDTVNLVGTLQSNGSPLPGDISEVIAGTGLSGGGTTGAVTINIDSAQPTITSLGTITSFTSTGIDDNATSTAITIDSSERVGIGNTTPSNYYSNKLVIDCGSASQDGLTIVSESTKDGMVSFADGTSGSNRYSGFILYDHADNEFRIATNGSEKMRILSDGKVGIGTTSPTTGANLTLSGQGFGTVGADSGSIAFGSNTSYQGRIYQDNATSDFFIENTYSSGEIAFKTNSSEKMRLTTTGLGIGTSSPHSISNLHVADTYANEPMIRIETSDGGNKRLDLYVSGGHGYITATQSAQDLNFATRTNLIFKTNTSSERMRIDSSGKVGIGTSSPSCALDVNGGSVNGNVFKTTTSGDNNYLAIDNTSTGGQEWVLNSSGNGSGNGGGAFAIQGPDSNTPRLLINSSGNVGIGTTSPASIGSNITTVEITGGSTIRTGGVKLSNSDKSIKASFYGSNTGFTFGAESNSDFKLITNNTERMRITSAGKITMNTTTVQSNATLTVFGNGVGQIACEASAVSDGFTAIFFRNPNGNQGSISTNSTSVSYSSNSDYRLKENVSYDFDATTRLKQLKPARFNFITDADITVDGFIAHEVSDIVPEAISGEKDAVKEDGTPDYQGIDQSKLVPLLVKTIQELEARITTLENA